MEKFELDREMLEEAEKHTSIYKGFGQVRNKWNPEVMQDVKFVIFRGGIPDWCIYYSTNLEDDWDKVESWGQKLHNKIDIEELVKTSDEVMKMYRH